MQYKRYVDWTLGFGFLGLLLGASMTTQVQNEVPIVFMLAFFGLLVLALRGSGGGE